MKKLLLTLSLVCAFFSQTVTFASLPEIKDLLPGKPSLNTTYPESVEELKNFLTPAEWDSFVSAEGLYYTHNGEKHKIRSFDLQSPPILYQTTLHDFAKFKGQNIDSSFVSKLSSNKEISVLFLSLKGAGENGRYITLLCLSGDKAEQWFTMDTYECSPLQRTYTGNKYPTHSIRPGNDRGYVDFVPIICVNEDYLDLTETEDDIPFVQFFVTYEDADWMFVDSIEINVDGASFEIDIDDIECTLGFKGTFVSLTSGTTEEREQFYELYDAIYESEESYNKYRKTLGKGLSLVDSATDTEDEPEETEKPEPEKEVESEEKEPEKITETEKEPTEPEKEPEPEVKEEEKTEPEQKEEEQEQKPIPSNPDEVSVIVNGKALEFSQEPVIENNRVLVPMRKIFESLGATVEWEQAEKRVFATKGEKQINLQIGSFVLNKGQDETVLLDAMPMLVNNHTLVPIRAVAESLDANVEWNASEKIVTIETK